MHFHIVNSIDYLYQIKQFTMLSHGKLSIFPRQFGLHILAKFVLQQHLPGLLDNDSKMLQLRNNCGASYADVQGGIMAQNVSETSKCACLSYLSTFATSSILEKQPDLILAQLLFLKCTSLKFNMKNLKKKMRLVDSRTTLKLTG